MSARDSLREEIDAAIARIDAKLAVGSDREKELQEERRDLEAARDEPNNSESG